MKRLKEEKNNLFYTLLVGLALAVALAAMQPLPAYAVGTTAGTTIANTATVSYTLGSDPTPLTTTASNSFEVLEVIDVALTWQDAASVAVNSPHSGRVLTFLLTNTGNGSEDFNLTADDALGGDQFDPAVQNLWIESNGSAGLQSDDTPYPVTGITMAADEAAIVYVLSDIPPGYGDGDHGDVQVTAQSLTPGAAGQSPGTLLTGAGAGGLDAVVGTSLAESQVTAAYVVATVSVSLTKSIGQIIDLAGGHRPSTGARVTYRIQVDASGSGTAQALVVSDPIPANMTYVPGSLLLDGAALTDAADGDMGDFDNTAPNTVTVVFNDTVAPATWIIAFDTTID